MITRLSSSENAKASVGKQDVRNIGLIQVYCSLFFVQNVIENCLMVTAKLLQKILAPL